MTNKTPNGNSIFKLIINYFMQLIAKNFQQLLDVKRFLENFN